MNGEELIEGIRAKLEREHYQKITDRELVDYLGKSITWLQNLRKRKDVTTRQVVGLIFESQKKNVNNILKTAISPIVEFFDLPPVDPKNETRTKIFETNGNQYLKGLQEELEANHGIYIFYDSGGRTLYIGKTERTLWQRINETYHSKIVKLRLVGHPQRNQKYKTLEEKDRQIRSMRIHLHELAFYISAYKVAKPLIHNTEALLIKSFANDLYNMKMEKMKFF